LNAQQNRNTPSRLVTQGGVVKQAVLAALELVELPQRDACQRGQVYRVEAVVLTQPLQLPSARIGRHALGHEHL
jgi:hypothetical protein